MVVETKDIGATLQTVSRAVAMLRCFEEGAARLSLAELTRRMQLNKVTVLRLATTLEAEGLLHKDPATGVYSISFGLLSLGRALLDPAGLIAQAQPIVNSIQDATAESAMINIRDGQHAVVVYEVLSPHPVRYALGVGYRADLRFGAASLSILAFLAHDECEALLAQPIPPRADGSVATAADVRAALDTVHRDGFATTDGQRVPDATGFAAPFFGPDGRVSGSLSVVMPASRARDKTHRNRCAEAVCDAAHELTKTLGGDRAVG